MGVRQKRPAYSRIEVLLILTIIAVSIGLLVPFVQKSREESARTQTMNNIKQCALATQNMAGTYNTKMPVNGAFGVRWGSVFCHILSYVEHDSIYKFISRVPNTEKLPAVRVTNWSDTSSALDANVYLTKVIPDYQSPLDPTPSAKTGHAANGFGTASFATNGYLFNPGSWADEDGFHLVAPATQKNTSFILNPVPPLPRFPATFVQGTSNVVMFATRYATCGADGQENYWSSPTRTYFDNTYPQIQPAPGTTATTSQELCNPAAPQAFQDRGTLICLGDGSARTVIPTISVTTWNRIISPQHRKSLEPCFE